MAQRFVCHRCGEVHEGLPAFGPDEPDAVLAVPEAERDERVVMNEDLCIVDGTLHFLRGCLDIPVEDDDEAFRFVVWVAVGRTDFDRAVEHWDDPARTEQRPLLGRLGHEVAPFFTTTTGLRCRVVWAPVGERPQVELEAVDHPLPRMQAQGVTVDVARAWVERLVHPEPPS